MSFCLNGVIRLQYPPAARNSTATLGYRVSGLVQFLLSQACDNKKNWLFFGHPEAGERSAVIYTLLGSCRRHGINPFDYLKDLFTRLPAAKIT
jgi:hypothetical protein